MRFREALSTFFAHLDAEANALDAMVGLLEREAVALRRLDLVELEATGAAKARVVEHHEDLTRRRASVLTELSRAIGCAHRGAHGGTEDPVAIRSVSTLIDMLSVQAGLDDEIERLESARRRLRSGAECVDGLHRRNRAFAETGRDVVSATRSRVARRRMGSTALYGPDGQVRGRQSSLLGRRRG